jgi:hypothetical protein
VRIHKIGILTAKFSSTAVHHGNEASNIATNMLRNNGRCVIGRTGQHTVKQIL